MKKALVFPGQGSQYTGMGKALYETSAVAQGLMDAAKDVLGFDLKEIMFNGTEEDLKRTSVTQPAIYVHSVALAVAGGFTGDAVAGHSLGEFSALAANGVLTFQDGLRLVMIRANAMQKACDLTPSTMAAIVGCEDAAVEKVCAGLSDVYPANYNSPGQLVISGSKEGIALAIEQCKAVGAKIAKELVVNGAFHSPFMQPAQEELAAGIEATTFSKPSVPIYQNVTGLAESNPDQIKKNLIAQLTSPVLWTQTMNQMFADGFLEFVELGPGKVLAGLIKRTNRDAVVSNLETLPA